MPHRVPQRDIRLEVRLIGHVVQSVLITRRKHSILHTRKRSARIQSFTAGAQPLKHQATVELSIGSSHRPRSNPSVLETRHPFQTAGQASYRQAQEFPYRLRVSSKMSPTGHPRDVQILSHLLRVGACQRAEAYTSRLVRCVRRTGQGRV